MLPHQADVSGPSKYAKALINYVHFGSSRQLTFEMYEQSLVDFYFFFVISFC